MPCKTVNKNKDLVTILVTICATFTEKPVRMGLLKSLWRIPEANQKLFASTIPLFTGLP